MAVDYRRLKAMSVHELEEEMDKVNPSTNWGKALEAELKRRREEEKLGLLRDIHSHMAISATISTPSGEENTLEFPPHGIHWNSSHSHAHKC